MSKRKHRRAFQPRFFIFLIGAAILVAALVLLVTTVVDKIKDTKARESLVLPIAQNPLATGTADANASPDTAPVAAGIIPTPLPLSSTGEYSVVAAESAKSQNTGFTSEVRINNEERIYTSYSRSETLVFKSFGEYSAVAGITTFAGNNYRNSFSYGTAQVTMQKLSSRWNGNVGSLGEMKGISWTGQPLIIQWSAEILPLLGVADSFKSTEGFTEVIYPAADGNIYFFELITGSQTRTPINVGVSLMGTGTLDPNGWPMLYVGQGVPSENSKGSKVSFVYAINLIRNEVAYSFGGKDYFAHRDDWNAFDSSPLIINDTLILPSESGVLYTIKLNTELNFVDKTIGIKPGDRVKFRYNGSGYSDSSVAGKRWYGFEASVAAFRNYLYLADNGGRLMCIDLNSLSLQFVADLGGDTDATPVIEEDGSANTIYIYTVNQTNERDASLPEGFGYCTVRKINGLSGGVVWEQKQACYVGDGSYKTGSRSTPHIGQGQLGNLLICAFYGAGVESVSEDGQVSYNYGGRLVAYDRSSGAVVWSVEQPGEADYLSSPVVIYSTSGAGYLIACDRAGFVKLYNAASGVLYDNFDAGSRIDSTPAAFGNYIVFGTTGTSPKIYCLKLD